MSIDRLEAQAVVPVTRQVSPPVTCGCGRRGVDSLVVVPGCGPRRTRVVVLSPEAVGAEGLTSSLWSQAVGAVGGRAAAGAARRRDAPTVTCCHLSPAKCRFLSSEAALL
jgi:hypothetical protein